METLTKQIDLSNFKPTKELEFDLMKSLLETYSRLKFFIWYFKDPKFVWYNQQNEQLFQLLEKQFHETKNSSEFSVEKFYAQVIQDAKEQITNFDIRLYLDLYQQNYMFHQTALDYYQFLKSKKITNDLKVLTADFESKKFNPDELISKLALIKNEIEDMMVGGKVDVKFGFE